MKRKQRDYVKNPLTPAEQVDSLKKLWRQEERSIAEDARKCGRSQREVVEGLMSIKLYDWEGIKALRSRLVTTNEPGVK